MGNSTPGSRSGFFYLLIALASLLLAAGCTRGREAHADDGKNGGTLSVLTYNVAGLPQFLSQSKPQKFIPLISPLLNHYDLVLVQEDFFYPADLAKRTRHPYRTRPAMLTFRFGLGDGLTTFSFSPFSNFQRHRWRACYGRLSEGSDCLTDKGFSRAEHRLSADAVVDVYNLHMDAGLGEANDRARSRQIEQLLETLAKESADRAVIVAGDTNLHADSETLYGRLLDAAKLTDACRAVRCPERYRIDRVMYRSSDKLALSPQSARIDDRFVTRQGQPLSDHDPLAVDFRWTLADSL